VTVTAQQVDAEPSTLGPSRVKVEPAATQPEPEQPEPEQPEPEQPEPEQPEPAADRPAAQVAAPPAEIARRLPAEVHPGPGPDQTILRRREQDQRHTRNFLVIFASTFGVGLMAYTFWLGIWAAPFGSGQRAGCFPGTPTPTAAPIKQTSVRVYNATDRRGLALNVARDLQKRGFLVPMWDNDGAAAGMKAPAEVRHGPAGLLSARTVAAQVNGRAVLVLDTNREGPTVDLVLGRSFGQLRSPAEAAKLIATPTDVPDVCPAGSAASSLERAASPAPRGTAATGTGPAAPVATH
jgi:hypothetical protein